MKMFLFVVMLLDRFYNLMIQIVSAILSPKSYEPILSMIVSVSAQVIGIKYISNKKPCSALGGTA
jgi:hypothetical protein